MRETSQNFDFIKNLFIKIIFYYKIDEKIEPTADYYQIYANYKTIKGFIEEYPNIDITGISRKNVYIDVLLCLNDDLNNSGRRHQYNQLEEYHIKELIKRNLKKRALLKKPELGGSFRPQRTIKVIRKY